MKGDKIIILPHHEKAASGVAELVLPQIRNWRGRFIITIAGESGAGKSEIAEALGDILTKNDLDFAILQQDDYFVYPPKTNAAKRHEDIDRVGTDEVRLDHMDSNLEAILEGESSIAKPLVDFDADSIGEESVAIDGIDVVLVDGTYTTLLENAHRRVFIDRTYIDTKDARALRAREAQDEFLERILIIEHEIISAHKSRADYVVTCEYDVVINEL